MNTYKESASASVPDSKNPASIKVHPLHVPIKIAGKDIVLNVSFTDAMIRFVVTIFLPIAVLLIDKHLVIYTAPVMAYLFITGITHFCVIKYIWHRFILREPHAVRPPYGENINYPEESV